MMYLTDHMRAAIEEYLFENPRAKEIRRAFPGVFERVDEVEADKAINAYIEQLRKILGFATGVCDIQIGDWVEVRWFDHSRTDKGIQGRWESRDGEVESMLQDVEDGNLYLYLKHQERAYKACFVVAVQRPKVVPSRHESQHPRP